jgi:DNA replication protein DnaC
MTSEFEAKKILVYGTGGSGKTFYAANELWTKFKTPMAYDVNGDFAKSKGGIVYHPADIDAEFPDFLALYKRINAKRRVDALFFDDAEVYIDYAMVADPWFKDLIVRHRNKGISLVFTSKRPQNLPTLVTNNYHIMKIFEMEGKNAIDRLKDEDIRIIPLLEKLKHGAHQHIHKVTNEEPYIKDAIKTR